MFKLTYLIAVTIPLFAAAFLFGRSKSTFVPPIHANGVDVVDFADHDLPPVRMGERVIDLMSGMHFDNLLQDTPDDLRPPSVILFYGHKSCPQADQETGEAGFTSMAETKLPSRERLLIARYDMDANPKRAWFKFTPEMDLPKRFGVQRCGEVVFVPRGEACNGFTEWCTTKTDDPKVEKAGCENFVDRCAPHVKRFSQQSTERDLEKWIARLVKEQGEPKISPVFGTYRDQRKWILERDETTTDNELRDYYLVEAFPAFTPMGFQAMPIPKSMNDWMMDFWNRRKANRKTEHWNAGSTQMSFHEAQTSFVSMDQESRLRDKYANEVLKPIVEKWSGISPLELTSFYGIREYKENWLRGHIDRIDTHVLSVTFSLGKLNASNIDQVLDEKEVAKSKKWPLEVYAWDGEIYRHEHPPGTMMLYESSKLIHGRPYHNEGPPHLGAFCHFKPVNMDKMQAQKWDDIAKSARQNQARNTYRGRYYSTPTVEPENPVYSDVKYGENTNFRRTGAPVTKEEDEDSYKCTFANHHNEALDIHWISPQGEKILQGTVGSGASYEVKTYVGHKFVWTEEGSEEPMPKGQFEIEHGSRYYKYGGSTPRVSKS